MRQIFQLGKSHRAVWYYEDFFLCRDCPNFCASTFPNCLHRCFLKFSHFYRRTSILPDKNILKRKGMRCFSTILITAVSVCEAPESRRFCDSCSLLKISTWGFFTLFLSFFSPPTASAQLGTMIDGRGATLKWWDRIHPARSTWEASEKLGPQLLRVDNVEKMSLFSPEDQVYIRIFHSVIVQRVIGKKIEG